MSVEVFELSAREAAELDAEVVFAYTKRSEFKLAYMNSRVREEMFEAIVREEGISGGWFWWTCEPGCLPDSCAFGPFATRQEAEDDAKEDDAKEEW